jgi:hypothetical protein
MNGWAWPCGHERGEHARGRCPKPLTVLDRAKRVAKVLFQVEADCPRCAARFYDHVNGRCPR